LKNLVFLVLVII